MSSVPDFAVPAHAEDLEAPAPAGRVRVGAVLDVSADDAPARLEAALDAVNNAQDVFAVALSPAVFDVAYSFIK